MRQWMQRQKAAMQARSRRRIALDYAQVNLELWADYGDPKELDRAIAKLYGATP